MTGWIGLEDGKIQDWIGLGLEDGKIQDWMDRTGGWQDSGLDG